MLNSLHSLFNKKPQSIYHTSATFVVTKKGKPVTYIIDIPLYINRFLIVGVIRQRFDELPTKMVSSLLGIRLYISLRCSVSIGKIV